MYFYKQEWNTSSEVEGRRNIASIKKKPRKANEGFLKSQEICKT